MGMLRSIRREGKTGVVCIMEMGDRTEPVHRMGHKVHASKTDITVGMDMAIDFKYKECKLFVYINENFKKTIDNLCKCDKMEV